MSALRVRYIDGNSRLDPPINTSLLVRLSQLERMDPFSPHELTRYPQSILVHPESAPDNMALGSIACKELRGLSGAKGKLAVIGGLLLDPSMRGGGIADELVRRITKRVFAAFPDVEACIAACNSASLPAFNKNGYKTTNFYEDVFEPADGFIAMAITRDTYRRKSQD